MRKDEIKTGGEYAVKTASGYHRKGKLPMSVVRAKVLRTDVEFTAKRYGEYRHWEETLRNGIEIEVMEILTDPDFSSDRGERVRLGRGAMSNQEWLEVGGRIVLEGGHDFVAPWPEYVTERSVIEQAHSEKQSEQWEQEQRAKLIGERLQALGFTVRKHGLPHRQGFVSEADYTIEGHRLTVEALDRLVAMVEEHNAGS